MSLPCKNVDVMSSICNLTKRFCIHCAGYEARDNIPKEIAKEEKVEKIKTTFDNRNKKYN